MVALDHLKESSVLTSVFHTLRTMHVLIFFFFFFFLGRGEGGSRGAGRGSPFVLKFSSSNDPICSIFLLVAFKCYEFLG